jgi:hypothetical protein
LRAEHGVSGFDVPVQVTAREPNAEDETAINSSQGWMTR